MAFHRKTIFRAFKYSMSINISFVNHFIGTQPVVNAHEFFMKAWFIKRLADDVDILILNRILIIENENLLKFNLS